MKYSLAYNAFHKTDSIGVYGISDKLIKYTYKNGNGRLKHITYANGNTMKATYNGYGQLVAEKWYANATDTVPMAYYKYAYDNSGNIVRSIDILSQKEYNYIYEQGRITRSTVSDITVDGNGAVTAKTLSGVMDYIYDKSGMLFKKVINILGTEMTYYYEYPENAEPVVKMSVGDKLFESRSGSDGFGRKKFDEIQLGAAFVSRTFSYAPGELTDAHVENGKVKSTPTTNLVSQIALSDGRTISYEYNEKKLITRITDSVEGITEYTYDALGQLLTERHKSNTAESFTAINTMTYDSCGNILTKNGTEYTYGDTVWKDKLTAVGNKTISYDKQGNPVNYLGNTLTWEKGRQLKKFVTSDNTVINYTYNANGVRTSKTVDGETHYYTLEGTKILLEKRGINTLIPLYDNTDSVCGINHNGTSYFFLKNLQGDVIAITDTSGDTVATYSYDAWGKCTVGSDSQDIAYINRFRYRGYYYDTETGLYYLQSRYYDPETGRFINGDSPEYVSVQGGNLFAYCGNNPVENADYIGFCFVPVVDKETSSAGTASGKNKSKDKKHLVFTYTSSIGSALIFGFNFFATIIFDTLGNSGLLLGTSLLFFYLSSSGISHSYGVYWKYKDMYDYLDSTTFSLGAGIKMGGALVYAYRDSYSSETDLVGIQIFDNGTGIFRETMPIDGGCFIDLTHLFKNKIETDSILDTTKRLSKIKIKVYRS